jgi:glycosyltransferase involved in cell wall biosynthesis
MVITNNPSRASFRQRIRIHLHFLRDNGIECNCIVYPRTNFARWKLLRQCSHFDAILLHKKTLNVFDAFWLDRYARRVIFNFDDAIMYDDRHPERRPSRRKHRKPFERTVRLANMVIAGNSYLADHARNYNKNVEVLATGLNLADYKVSQQKADDGKIRLVWIGSKSTLKYLAEIKPAIEEIGSRFDNVVLRIICDDFFGLNNMEVEECRWSAQTQVRDLVTSDIGLAPLPDNRFTRGKCGFKILQYAAAGLPVIASPVGVNAQYVGDGVTGFHAAGISDWVNGIGRLLENAGLTKSMGRQGRTWVESFDVGVIGKRLTDLIKESLQDDGYSD